MICALQSRGAGVFENLPLGFSLLKWVLGAYRRSEGVNPVRHRGAWDDELLSKVVHLIALEKRARGVVRKRLVAGPRVLEGVRVSVQVRGVVRILGDRQN